MFMLICDEKTDALTLFMPVDPVDFGQSVTVCFHSEAASACTNSSLKRCTSTTDYVYTLNSVLFVNLYRHSRVLCQATRYWPLLNYTDFLWLNFNPGFRKSMT